MQPGKNKNVRNKLFELCDTANIMSRITDQEIASYKIIMDMPEIKNIINDAELMKTINVFFTNNLNISATSKSAFMHRNTLIYRLDKIKRETGFNIKQFEDAVLFTNILKIKEIVEIKEKQAKEK